MPSRETLFLLPGLLCDSGLWEFQVTALADKSEPIVADSADSGSSIAAFAEAVLAAAPDRFALAGLSMGGYVAFEILRRAPDRVTRLALLDTSARPESLEAGARRRSLMSLSEGGRFSGVTPRLLPQLVHPDHVHGPVGASVMAMAGRVGATAYLRQAKACLDRPDSRPGLGSIAVPTLIICGAEDHVTPPDHSIELAQAIPGAELLIVPGSGHLTPLEVPEAVNRAMLDWLAW